MKCRECEVWSGKCGVGSVERCGEMWRDVERCGEMWRDVERCGELSVECGVWSLECEKVLGSALCKLCSTK